MKEEFDERDAVKLAEQALKNSSHPKNNVIKGKAVDERTGYRCEALIANNTKGDVSEQDLFDDYKIKFNYYDGETSLFEVAKEQVHDEIHVHTGKDRRRSPLSSVTVASLLSSTSDMIVEGHRNWDSNKS